MTTPTPKQLSRVAGVPRLKLPIWKAAAAQFFQGKPDPSRDEQRNSGKKTKVALLRELAASDPEVKSWVIKFATDLRGRDARQIAAEQGFVMPEKLGFVPLFPGDYPELSVMARSVICMEKPNAAELLEKLTTLYPDGDPPEVVARENAKWAEYQRKTEAQEEMKRNQPRTCGNCGQPATRTIKWQGGRLDGQDIPWCDKDHRPGQLPAPPDPQSPTAYINSDFGKEPTLDPTNPAHNRALALKALGEAIAGGPRPRGGVDFGPTSEK